MDRAALRAILREMVEDNTGEPCQCFVDDTDLRSGLGLDSVDVITLAMEIQEKLGVRIEIADFSQLHSVGDLLDLIQEKAVTIRRAA